MDLFKNVSEKLTKEQKESVQKLYDISDKQFPIKSFKYNRPYKLSKKEKDILLYNMPSAYVFGIYWTEYYLPIDLKKFDPSNESDVKF